MEYLYHYTSLDTLNLVLRNRTIRFCSLDQMDDLQEKETDDVKNLGQFVYISSWTEDTAESIPMWHMYASLDKGVRIKLRKCPFKYLDNYPSEMQAVSNLKIESQGEKGTPKTLIKISDMLKGGYVSQQAMMPQESLLFKVDYTSDTAKLYPRVAHVSEDRLSIGMGLLGKHKNMAWKFQSEWRYILNIIPLNLNQAPTDSINDFNLIANRMLLGMEKQNVDHIDLTVDDEAFAEMEIVMSPRMNADDRALLRGMVAKYNPTAKIVNSELLGLI